MADLLGKIRRGIRKPPKVIIKRLHQEGINQIERCFAKQRAERFGLKQLLEKTKTNSLEQLWQQLSDRVYCVFTQTRCGPDYEKYCPNQSIIILKKAALACQHQVDLLGSGLVALGQKIDWHKDYKTNHHWPIKYMRDIDYNNPERPSDVKFPWEVSRLQWLIPAGQAYLLTGEEHYAQTVKDVLDDWIKNNPYSYGINWACTMEVALRILSWTWFFHVFKQSEAWRDQAFQQQFLKVLYLHADFTQRHLEFSDVNGNHYTADAAGLVFAGCFFGNGREPQRWQDLGWDILCQELPLQVFADGVDFEASVAYHRLVLELFFLPALYREKQGLETPVFYKDRLALMAQFSNAYSRQDGSTPFWGDADDARALPLGNQPLQDHRYLSGWIAYTWSSQTLAIDTTQALSEYFWVLGPVAVTYLQQQGHLGSLTSQAFPHGGFYVMRNEKDHIFIDCGPLGLAGRGGHGHNDCLSFEAMLDGVKLISDCGSYVYTASYQERNLFRSTAYHNTPCIDNLELNRFIRWDYLWNMHYDAQPQVASWLPGADYDYFCGSHTGYQRLNDPVLPKRSIILDHKKHSLIIQDNFLCDGSHEVSIPLHLDPQVRVELVPNHNRLILRTESQIFNLVWESTIDWVFAIEPTRISPRYGLAVPSQKLLWNAQINGPVKLDVCILPECYANEQKEIMQRLRY